MGTIKDNQSSLDIEIYQGEHRPVKDNIKLGSLEISVPLAPAGKIVVELRYTYDINGLLEVEAHIPATGITKSLVIEENPGVLSPMEITQRLEKLKKIKIHPKDESIRLLSQEGSAYGKNTWEIPEIKSAKV